MYTIGIDIGSTTSKCVILRDGAEIVSRALFTGGIGTKSPEKSLEETLRRGGLERSDLAAAAATGYGRNRWEGADWQLSELSCHAMGAHQLFPDVRTIIDIGGQDAKVIALNADGRMQNFLMNDKCAAGTGRFLDVMAAVLQTPVADFGDLAAQAGAHAPISSTCTVFAESEVISQLANGVELCDLVAGICDSVAARVAAQAKRLGVTPRVCMSGGVAYNGGVRAALEKELGTEIAVSPLAQYMGALGAARYAWEKKQKEHTTQG